MNKVLKPKILAITCIISSIIYILFSFIYQSQPFFLGYNQYNEIITIFGSLLFHLIMISTIYTIVYLYIVFNKKEKNMDMLNLLLLINYILAFIFYIIIMISNKTFNIFSILLSLLFVIIISGIYTKKERPYKILTISALGISIIYLISDFIQTINLLLNGKIEGNSTLAILFLLIYFIGKVCQIVAMCSFALFLYLYGKNINERKEKNER